MTMLSFRLDDEDAASVRRWVEQLGVDRSEFLREAVRERIKQLQAEADAEAWEKVPLTPEEASLSEIADWGPAEDWSDWEGVLEARDGVD